MIRAK